MESLNEENKCLRQIISDKDEEIKQLKIVLAEGVESKDEKQHLNIQENTIRILAPNCKDILEKYAEKLDIKFEDATERTKEDLLQQYDQIWVLPTVVSFATNRKLNKWKTVSEGRIVIFSSASELLARAETMI